MEQSPDLTAVARAARGGDPRAVEQFLRAVQPIVVRAVRLVVGPGSALAEEACQDALMDILRGLPGLSAPERAAGWAMRIAMRRALRAARRHDLRARLTRGGDALEQAREPQAVPVRILEIRQAFDTLPPRLRAVAVLRLYAGLSEGETAEALACSPGTVKSRLHTARTRLQRILGDDDADSVNTLHTVRRPT